MKTVLSMGNFDGLHIGHKKLLSRVRELAEERNLKSVVITYDNHPAQTLNNNSYPYILLPPEHKRTKILDLGIDEVQLLHFDEKLAKTSAEDFLREYLMAKYNPAIIVLGYDSHFGYQRRGNYQFLLEQSKNYGFEVEYVEPVLYNNRIVSSSLIREMLISGNLYVANRLLGYPYTLYGTVGRGRGIGRELGFPTVNLQLEDTCQLVPYNGVYFSIAQTGDLVFYGLTNIGISPTLKHKDKAEIETYLLDIKRDFNDYTFAVSLLHYLREERMFPDKDALIRAIEKDVALAKKLVDNKIICDF
ncbi:MAG TPA: bifunctional riboflavin kinase/FAD synthetase [Candidatus Syntrophosphaera thermopropionivorans]|jgi:riboflavin kinase/FMN adenylyltransferase|nr:bifunctional riboflavin kinase/FAD synthetase [Candidatus Syntrophosphaera thermopropionivorans]